MISIKFSCYLCGLPALVGAAAMAVSPPSFEGDPVAGKFPFDSKCLLCHGAAVSTEIGPTLNGVFNRKAGSRSDFRYSPAMKAADFKWDRAHLDRFLIDPGELVPGCLQVGGVDDAMDRADLIAYMRDLN